MNRRGRAFTLIELLVVLAIIAILASLLIPGLLGAKGMAHRMDCISRQKQWAVVFKEYSEDHEDNIPREAYSRSGEVVSDNWSQVRGRLLPDGSRDNDDVWYNALPPLLPQQPPARKFSALYDRPHFYNKRLLFHCPSADFPRYSAYPTYQYAMFSMAMNSHLIQFPFVPTIKFSRIGESDITRIPLFLDNRLEGERKVYPMQADDFLGQPAAYANRFAARHGKGGNLVFADGHAEWMRGTDVVDVTGGMIIPPVNILWEPEIR